MIRVRLSTLPAMMEFAGLRVRNFEALALVLVEIAHLTLRSVCRICQPCHGVQFGLPFHEGAAGRHPSSPLHPPCEIRRQGGYFPQPLHTALQRRRVFQL